MSSCLHSDWLTRQLRWTAALLSLLAPSAACAQMAGSEEPFLAESVGRTYLGTTPLRIWHRTRGYGQEASETAFGGRAAIDLADAVGFVDGQFRVSNESQFGANLGGGYRWQGPGILSSGDRIWGISGWYDGQETRLSNYFNQAGFSFESLGEFIDLRFNANIPFEDSKLGDELQFTGEAGFQGNLLTQHALVANDVALRVVDFEVAPRVYNLNAWVYANGYQMDGDGVSEFGGKVGGRGYVTNDLAVDVGVSDDDVFGTNTVAQIIWTPGRTGSGPTSWIHTLADRMREQVYRNTYVATTQSVTTQSIALTDAEGDNIRVVHVDVDATAPGDGSFENPYSEPQLVNGAGSLEGDIILVHARPMGPNSFDDQSVILKDEQRLLGEGGGNEHLVTTSELGEIALPETYAGALNGVRPTIDNSGTALNAVLLAVGNDDVSSLSPIEISNFDITGGARAVYSDDDGAGAPTGVGGVNINHLAVSTTSGNAIELNPLNETLADNTTRLRFQPTISDVTFTGVGGDDIRLTSAEPNATSTVETIVLTDITSTGGNGVGINLIGNKRAVTITDFVWDGLAVGDGALRIEDAVGNVTLNGTSTISNGQAGTAFGIALVDGAGVHAVTGTTITNTGGASIVANGGSGDLNFTGRIDQANAASVVSATNDHSGDITFRELTAGAGVIGATNGDGLQFNDVSGVYTFVHEVVLNGGDAGIDIINATGATVTLAEATITSPTGTAVNVDGGSSNLSLTGRIVQANNAAVLTVSNEHTGSLTFNESTAGAGVIEASNGSGLQFNNADGTYTFNHRVFLNNDTAGDDAGVDVTNDSESSIAFDDLDITNPAGVAINIDGSNVNFTSEGEITANNANAVVINGNSGGSILINNTITSDEGIVVSANTGGTFRFGDQVTLTGTDSDAVTILNNTAGSTQFDNIDITKTGAGDGFVANSAAAGHTVTVLGSGNTISTADGIALQLDDVAIGGGGVNFQKVDSSNAAGSAIIINNVTGGPINIGAVGAAVSDGGAILSSGGTAVSITNAANVTLNGLRVDGATLDGIEINHSGSANSVVRVNNAEITNVGGIGIDYNRSASATSRFTLTSTEINGTGAEGITLDVSGSGTQDITINNGNTVTAAANSALALNTTGGLSKTVNVLIDGNQFTNTGTASTVAIVGNGSGTINATVTDNSFTNNDNTTGRAYSTQTLAGTVRLDFNNNTATNAGASDEVLLTETAGTFTVVDLATIETRNNNAQVEQVGTITNDAGPIPQPTP